MQIASKSSGMFGSISRGRRTWAVAILRSAVLSQMPPGRTLLESCARDRPPNLEVDYKEWVDTVTALLSPDYSDLARKFTVAPIPEPTNDDYKIGVVTFGMHPLWREIWKKLRVLEQIERELGK